MGGASKEMSRKTENVILRISDRDHSIIRSKASLFGYKKSEFIRYASLSFWPDGDQISYFKELLKKYSEGDDSERSHVVDVLFAYYRRTGFPHSSLTDEQKINRMERVSSSDILMDGMHLQMNFQGIDLANSYHPHMMQAGYRGARTPYENFADDKILRGCIRKWLDFGKTPNPAGMRRILRTYNGSRSVVNFRPTVAKFIYDRYVPDGGEVLDPCAGYGGRLSGCISSSKNILYHGIDPDPRTASGNMNMASFFRSVTDDDGVPLYRFRYRFDLGCAEDVMRNINGKYSAVFTSPPYFDLETYDSSVFQSDSKFTSYEEWLEGFLWVLVDQSLKLLDDHGVLVLNVKNTNRYAIADDLLSHCGKDWVLEKIYHMRLPNSEYKREVGNTWHTEPIFVFRKK
jgi:hypothetical protein